MSEESDAAEEEIAWASAVELLGSGRIVLAGQSHSRKVRLTDDAGHRYVTEEPEIDAILHALIDLPAEQRNNIAFLSE